MSGTELQTVINGSVTSETSTGAVLTRSNSKHFVIDGTGFSEVSPSGEPGTGTVTSFTTEDVVESFRLQHVGHGLLVAVPERRPQGFGQRPLRSADNFVSNEHSTSQSFGDLMHGFGGNDNFNMNGAAERTWAQLFGDDGNDVFSINYNGNRDTIDGGTGNDILRSTATTRT